MLKSKLNNPIRFATSMPWSYIQITAFEKHAEIARFDEQQSAEYSLGAVGSAQARQIAYALLLAADAVDRAQHDRESRKGSVTSALEDLNAALYQADRQQRDAAEAVRDAQINLMNANLIGDPVDIEDAKAKLASLLVNRDPSSGNEIYARVDLTVSDAIKIASAQGLLAETFADMDRLSEDAENYHDASIALMERLNDLTERIGALVFDAQNDDKARAYGLIAYQKLVTKAITLIFRHYDTSGDTDG